MPGRHQRPSNPRHQRRGGRRQRPRARNRDNTPAHYSAPAKVAGIARRAANTARRWTADSTPDRPAHAWTHKPGPGPPAGPHDPRPARANALQTAETCAQVDTGTQTLNPLREIATPERSKTAMTRPQKKKKGRGGANRPGKLPANPRGSGKASRSLRARDAGDRDGDAPNHAAWRGEAPDGEREAAPAGPRRREASSGGRGREPSDDDRAGERPRRGAEAPTGAAGCQRRTGNAPPPASRKRTATERAAGSDDGT